ncbi:hypothetical protein AALP_AA6G093200 [Arabis alpina]|uniref:Uncharacterized protein n=1 Tax=Arabis alpina TaxID=50452 RepID=A0A087GN37_ARAAL|nr:hypothetical protein AALP_AA6G093200 [Arabis alpina]
MVPRRFLLGPPSGIDVADMQRADDASARGLVPGKSNGPKSLGDVSRSKGKGKVDPVDKKAEKKRIAAKAKADLEAGRIPSFRIGGTCEVLPSKALVAQSLGVTPPASLPVTLDSAVIPPCPAVRRAADVPHLPAPRDSLTPSSRPASELSSESSLSKRRQDRLREERDGARHRADEIASGSSARSARYSSRLERIHSYLIALHAQEEVKAQLCYRCGARISLEKMVEAEYELLPGLLENYANEEKEYLAKVESLTTDSLGDDILFSTPPPPPTSPPRDVSSQVPEGISENGSFLSPQDN